MKVLFKGNIGKDAEYHIRKKDGVDLPVCSFWVAEKVNRVDKDVLWHKVTLWRRYAEVMAPHLKKGRRIEVIGKVHQADAYTREDPVTHEKRLVPYVDVWGEEVELLDLPKQPTTDTPPEVVAAENAAAIQTEATETADTPWD